VARSAYSHQSDVSEYYGGGQIGASRPDDNRDYPQRKSSLNNPDYRQSNVATSNSDFVSRPGDIRDYPRVNSSLNNADYRQVATSNKEFPGVSNTVDKESFSRLYSTSETGGHRSGYAISNPNLDRYPESFGKNVPPGSTKYVSNESGAREVSQYAGSVPFSKEPVRQMVEEPPRQEHTGRDATFAKAREMAQRTKDILSKIGGWKSISLHPTTGRAGTKSDDIPASGLMYTSNSAYTRLSAKSTTAQTILKNINLMAASLTGSNEDGSHGNGGVAVIHRQSRPTASEHISQLSGLSLPSFMNRESATYNQGIDRANQSTGETYHGMGISNQTNRAAQRTTQSKGDAPCPPAVTNMLHNIGFNFELSQLMQDKAKAKEEQNRKEEQKKEEERSEQDNQRMLNLYQSVGGTQNRVRTGQEYTPYDTQGDIFN